MLVLGRVYDQCPRLFVQCHCTGCFIGIPVVQKEYFFWNESTISTSQQPAFLTWGKIDEHDEDENPIKPNYFWCSLVGGGDDLILVKISLMNIFH